MIQDQRPDLKLLLDLLMPQAHGTRSPADHEIHEATRSIPVLILTNSSRAQDIEEIRELGADGYQIKANLSLEALGTQIKKLLKD